MVFKRQNITPAILAKALILLGLRKNGAQKREREMGVFFGRIIAAGLKFKTDKKGVKPRGH